jgi:mRNA-degrading endonuclease toxin of MazEF toxin-antitoxin module
MYAERKEIPVTTAADGSATAYSDLVTGAIYNIIYKKTDFADGVDFAITLEETGQNLWTESDVNAEKIVSPRQTNSDNLGGTNDNLIIAAKDRIKVVIADGGNAKSGKFIAVLV